MNGEALAKQFYFVTLLDKETVTAEKTKIATAADSGCLLRIDCVTDRLFTNALIEVEPACAVADTVNVVLGRSNVSKRFFFALEQNEMGLLAGAIRFAEEIAGMGRLRIRDFSERIAESAMQFFHHRSIGGNKVDIRELGMDRAEQMSNSASENMHVRVVHEIEKQLLMV